MRLSLLVSLAMAVATPALAEQSRYALTLAGVSLGALTFEAEAEAASYHANARFQASGLGGLLGYRFDGSALGRLGGKRDLAPIRFTATSQSPRASRQTRVDWDGDAPPFVAVDPPRAGSVEPEAAIGALDPVSALLRLSGVLPGRACALDLTVFDGSRLARLSLAAPMKAEDGLRCAGVYRRLGGEPLTPVEPAECPFTLVYSLDAKGHPLLEEIRVPTRFGQALIARVS